MDLRATVIGPGALGCLFAGRLCQAGIETSLCDHRLDRAERLRKSGVYVETETEQIHVFPNIVTSVPSCQDLVIILVKSFNTNDLILPDGMPVLTFQNGLGNAETLCSKVKSSALLVGVTTEAAYSLGDGHVKHAASGLTTFGAWTTCPTRVAETVLAHAGFNFELTDSPGRVLWEKVCINAGINPLTALLDVPNGRLVEISETRALMRDLIVEGVKVATTEGYRFPYSLIERAEEVCRQTKTNISSMLQDIRAGRSTEIEAISGEIIRRGQVVGLPTPRTRVIYQLIRGLEQK